MPHSCLQYSLRTFGAVVLTLNATGRVLLFVTFSERLTSTVSGPGRKLDGSNYEKPLRRIAERTVEPESTARTQRDRHFERDERVREDGCLCHL